MDVYYKRGLWINLNGQRLLFDPTSAAVADYTFVSHGHSDHANGKTKLAKCSPITAEVLNTRYGTNVVQNDFEIETLNAGHVMGSTQFLIGDTLYTGDMNFTDQLTEKRAEVKSAKNLIIEATYGSPEYVFPDHFTVLDSINEFVKESFSKDRPAVFYAYSLGRAQELSMLLQKYSLFVEKPIFDMNQIYSKHKKKIKCHLLTDGVEFESNEFVAIFRSRLMGQNKHLLAKVWGTNTPMTAVPSGWALMDWFKYGVAKKYDLDATFPLSSHADFNGLCDFVSEVSPKKIYTVYGNNIELAKQLTGLGYDAEPVPKEPQFLLNRL